MLVVRNMPRATALGASVTGVLVLVGGAVLLPLACMTSLLSGAEVLLSAMGTVFVLAGATVAALGARMLGSRTHLAMEREKLTVTVHAAWGPERRHVVRVEDIERVGLDNDCDAQGATYSVRIIVRGREPIVLDDARTSARAHHERVAAEIRGFLSAA
jgi:hypothetical protein